MYKTHASLFIAIAAVLFTPQVRAQQVAAETPQTMLAAQIRTQGFTCDKALGATRDRKRSRPDRAVWVLKCSNATYRVTRAPDMAAKVDRSRERMGQIPSARRPVQTTIKPTMITARKLEEVISSRMTTPMPQSGKDH